MGYEMINLPPQQLPFSKKNKAWRKKHLDWADSKTFFNYSLVRKSVIHKKINYDLLNGKLHMSDLEIILNPEKLQAGFIPDRIQHYPIMNSKLNVLRGEESKRVFDFKVVVTNPNAITEIENNKKQELLQKLQEWVSNTSQSEEEANQELEKINDYYSYEWQDMREIRANALLNHYIKELKPEEYEVKLGDKAGDGTQLRPFIVWFGEAVPEIETAIQYVEKADIFVIIGTSLNVYPAAGLLHYVPREAAVYLIDPKPVDTHTSRPVHVIQKGASEGVAELKQLLGV